MDLFVTNNPEVEADDKIVQDFNSFWRQANDEGLELDGDLIIDVAALPDQGSYDDLVSTGIDIRWISIEGMKPSWFNGPCENISFDEEDDEDDSEPVYHAMADEDLTQMASALGQMDEEVSPQGNSYGKIITFGSSKGGAGKTFTALITAKYYAQDHPNDKVAFLDLDIEEPQVGTAIAVTHPTLKKFYSDYLAGDKSFDTMQKYKANNKNMPPNLDFYLTPRDAHVIIDNNFWLTCMTNLFQNYDMVILDTGTSYLTLPPIQTAYKIADKLIIVSQAGLTSTIAVGSQIRRLCGEIPNDIYSEADELASKINLVVTNVYEDEICDMIISKIGEEAPIVAKFGRISPDINRIQILGKWDLFDSNLEFRDAIKHIYKI